MCTTDDPCLCPAYPFPHRPGGGACPANESPPFCVECGKPCGWRLVDFGIGPHEYWGYVGCHSDVQPASDCCEAGLAYDPMGLRPYEPEPEPRPEPEVELYDH